MELKQFKNNEEKKKQDKIILIAQSYLNSVGNIISKALTDNEFGHEEFKTIMNKEDKYCNLKENIRMIRSQRSHEERDKLKKMVKIWVSKMTKLITIYNIYI